LALSRIFDSAARHPSTDAIAQFGHVATMAVPLSLNFTWTISNGLRQCGQKSAWPSPRLVTAAIPLARDAFKTELSTAALITRITLYPNERE
jgi:hypothetical protein